MYQILRQSTFWQKNFYVNIKFIVKWSKRNLQISVNHVNGYLMLKYASSKPNDETALEVESKTAYLWLISKLPLESDSHHKATYFRNIYCCTPLQSMLRCPKRTSYLPFQY